MIDNEDKSLILRNKIKKIAIDESESALYGATQHYDHAVRLRWWSLWLSVSAAVVSFVAATAFFSVVFPHWSVGLLSCCAGGINIILLVSNLKGSAEAAHITAGKYKKIQKELSVLAQMIEFNEEKESLAELYKLLEKLYCLNQDAPPLSEKYFKRAQKKIKNGDFIPRSEIGE